jgi:Fic family protein
MSLFFANLDPDVRAILLAQIRNLWTHTSTAIEGNTLTLGDTAFLLEEGLTVGGKPLKDHQEVVGHARAIDLLYDLLERGGDAGAVTEEDLFILHRAVQTEVVLDIYQPVGQWKNEPNFTSFVGTDNRQHWREYPRPANVPQLMQEWLESLNLPMPADPPTATLAAHYGDLHLTFVTIHPFNDANGRMARLLANIPVLRLGFPPIVVPTESRQRYKAILSEYQETIADLAGLQHLAEMPENAQRQAFRELCSGFWERTLTLVDGARAMQREKNLGTITSSSAPSKSRKGL